MEVGHEIKRLDFQIDGRIDFETEQIIREVLPDIIEHFFDKYDLPGKSILIDKIHFDLGAIKSDNFREELAVRLSYLLQTELEEFFEQPNLENLLEAKISTSNADAFIIYLEYGYSILEDKDLNQLFEYLLKVNLSLLHATMLKVSQSSVAANRLFNQVEYANLERYWQMVHPVVFKQIKSIHQGISSFTEDLNDDGLGGLLKRRTFDFMIGNFDVGNVAFEFLEKLKEHIDDFKSYEHVFGQSAFEFFDSFSKRFLLQDTASQQTSINESDHLDVILDYILDGSSTYKQSNIDLSEKYEELTEQEVQLLFSRLAQKRQLKQDQIERLLDLASNKGLNELLSTLKQKNSDYIRTRIDEVSYLRLIVKELFGEDIYQLNILGLSEYLVTTSSNDKKLISFIKNIIEYIAARKFLGKSAMVRLLTTRAKRSGHKHAQFLSRFLQQLESEFEVSITSGKNASMDHMHAYMHFLRSGVWMLEETNPQEVFITLIGKSLEHLTIQLRKHLGFLTVWVRLVYQHPVKNVIVVFESVFSDDKDLGVLKKGLEGIEPSELKDSLQRKMMEAFIVSKSIQGKSELSFKVLFEKNLYKLSIAREFKQESDELGLSRSVDKLLSYHLTEAPKGEKLKKDEKSFILNSIIAQPHILFDFINDQDIVSAKWESLFRAFDKKELIVLLKIVLGLRPGMAQWVFLLFNSLGEAELVRLLQKPGIIKTIQLLIDGQLQKVEDYLVEHTVRERDPALLKMIDSSIPFRNWSSKMSIRDIPISIHSIPKKEFIKATKNLDVYFEELIKSGLVSIVYRRNLMFDLLPFAKTADELKRQVLTRLMSDYTHYKETLGKILKVSHSETIEKKDFTTFVQQLIESNSFDVQPYFKDFNSFEIYFTEGLGQSDDLFNALSRVNHFQLINFLQQLSEASLSLLDQSIQKKYLQSDFSLIIEQILELNQQENKELRYASIAYGLTHSKFNTFNFIAFLETNVSNIQLKEIRYWVDTETISSSVISKLYVEAFLHYLQFKKYIYLPLEQDGIDVALNKILAYHIDEFLDQLQHSGSIELLMKHLFLLTPDSRQSRMFIQLFPFQSTAVDYIYKQVQKAKDVSRVELLSTWSELVLTNRKLLNTNQILELLLSTFEPESKALSNPLKLTLTDPGKGLLPEHIIEEKYQNLKYSITDLMADLMNFGRWPIWLKIQSQQQLIFYIKDITSQSTTLMKKVLGKELKTVVAAKNLTRVIGFSNFQKIIKIVEPEAFGAILENVEKLSQTHLSLGQKETLDRYFFLQYVGWFYTTNKASSRVIIANILSQVAYDFGLSTSDYRDMLQKSREKIITEFLGYEITDKDEEKGRDISHQVNLLLHLVTKKEVPWWASESLFQLELPLEKQVTKLVANLFERAPKELMTSIFKRTDSEQIFRLLFPLVTNQQFNKILLILAPNFGGFIVSFNLLLTRSEISLNRSLWLAFLLRIVSQAVSFKASTFMRQALVEVSRSSGQSLSKLKAKLLTTAKTAIQNGEMRFLPFIELLGMDYEEKGSIERVDRNTEINPYGFVNTFSSYLRTGSLSTELWPQVKSYTDLVYLIERQREFGHSELRLIVIKELANEQTRARLVQREKERFLIMITNLLFPTESKQVLIYKSKLTHLLKQKWSNASSKVFNELFYRSIFEQVLDTSFQSLKAEDLISSFVQKTNELLHIEIIFNREELEELRLDEKLIDKFIVPAPSKKRIKLSKKTVSDLLPLGSNEDSLVDQRLLIKNAGLVITWPYLTRYFSLLEMTEDDQFKTETEAIRAVHLLQYIAVGTTLAPEHELLLNKVLCGLKIATPVPMEVALTDKEIETSEMMLGGLIQNWEKLKSSSIDALREGFLTRDGYIFEKEKTWELKVEKKTLDILMEDMPWSFGKIKLPWMEKRLNVEWL